MKSLIKILVIALVILSGCKTSRKITESSVVKSSVNTEEIRAVKEIEDLKENKDVNSELETTTEETTTDFYPPTEAEQGAESNDAEPKKGAVRSVRTVRTVTTKRDSDKSKVEATNERQEDTSLKKQDESEVRSRKSEVKKTGVAQWKIIGAVILVLLVVYFLVKKNIIRIPFLTRTVQWINRLLGLTGIKAA